MRLFDRAEQNLIEFVRQCQQLIVINFDDERNFVRVLSRDAAQDTEGRSDAVAAAFDRQLHDVPRIEIFRIRSK